MRVHKNGCPPIHWREDVTSGKCCREDFLVFISKSIILQQENRAQKISNIKAYFAKNRKILRCSRASFGGTGTSTSMYTYVKKIGRA